MLIMAACGVNDPEEDEKIRAISRAFDRAYVMLQLNRAYDSNQFQEFLYTLHPFLPITENIGWYRFCSRRK